MRPTNNTTLTEPSFNSGLVIKASERDTIRLTAGRGLQLPSLIDFGLQFQFRGLDLTGSPSALPTVVWNAELGYDRVWDVLGATSTAAIFFQRNTDLIEAPGSAPPVLRDGVLVSQTSNIGSSNEIGFEVGLRGGVKTGFNWNASYRYASITQDTTSASTAVPGPFANYSTGTPVHEIVVGAGYSIDRWEFDAQGRWQSSYTDYSFVPPAFREPFVVNNYVAFNARVGYRALDRLTLAGTAQQFNVSRLVQTSGDFVDRRFIASATWHY
ncbi:MAG: hypothetical protein WDN04_19795 [Rhodospirillales bacterium]